MMEDEEEVITLDSDDDEVNYSNEADLVVGPTGKAFAYQQVQLRQRLTMPPAMKPNTTVHFPTNGNQV